MTAKGCFVMYPMKEFDFEAMWQQDQKTEESKLQNDTEDDQIDSSPGSKQQHIQPVDRDVYQENAKNN